MIFLMIGSDLQWHDSLQTKINLLHHLPLLPVVHIEMSAVVAILHILQIQSTEEASWMPPLGGDQNIVIRLIPEIVAKKNYLFASKLIN